MNRGTAGVFEEYGSVIAWTGMAIAMAAVLPFEDRPAIFFVVSILAGFFVWKSVSALQRRRQKQKSLR